MALTSDSLGSPEQHPDHRTSGSASAAPEASVAELPQTPAAQPPMAQTRRARREAELALTARATAASGSKASPSAVRPAAGSAAVARMTSSTAASVVVRAASPVTASSSVVPRSTAGAAVTTTPSTTAPSAERRAPRFARPTKRGVISTIVMTAAAGLIATMALPAYAFSTSGAFDPAASTGSLAYGQQTLNVDASVADATVSRDNYQAPTKDDLAAAEAKAKAEAAAAAAALQVATISSTSSGSVANTLTAVSPPSGPYSGEAVVAYAMQFVGKVPYGSGASPDTSFGCDGLTQYVFKQFGINIPRTVSNQAAAGTRISAADAQPGDLMIYPIGHVGIYAGNGMMIDSPDWGRYVEYRPQWGSFYYVRLGI